MNPIRKSLAAVMMAFATFSAQAELARVGPVDPANGFPAWYQDFNGQVLDLCLATAPDLGAAQQNACFLVTPPPYTFPTAFPDEAFYFNATSDPLPTGPGMDALLVIALEAAFAQGPVIAGDQIVFARMRIRAGLPFPGTYTFNHPYGTDIFTVDAVGGIRDVNFTQDIGIGTFAGALKGRIGPFLQPSASVGGAPTPPVTLNGAQFLTDGLNSTRITGSPFFNAADPTAAGPGNWFEICGPLDGPPPQAERCVRQEQFSVIGRLHDLAASPIGSPMTVERATFTRDAANNVTIDVSATAIPGIGQNPSKLSVGAADVPPVLMAGPDSPALGHFYARGVPFPPTVLSSQVTVTNSGDNPPTSIALPLADAIAVSQANYDAGAQTLTVVATSSDAANNGALILEGYPAAVKTVGCNATTACSTFVASAIAIPPPNVAVSSALGGRGVLDTTIGGVVAPFPPGVVFTQDDNASASAGGAPVVIDVLFNDTDNAAAPHQVPVNIIAPATLGSAVANPDGTVTYTPPAATTGTDSFKYTVSNSVGQSNVSTVSVTVGANATPIPTATTDTAAVTAGGSVTIDVLANDLANGGTLDPATVTITTPPATGTATVNTSTGAITYTADANAVTGIVDFAYTVKDTVTATNPNPTASAPATVSVSVTAAAPGETLTVKIPAKCKVPNQWDLTGTSSEQTGSITIYSTGTVPTIPTADQIIATVPISAGRWQFRNGSVNCTLSMSLQSGLGTKLENIAVQVR